MIKKTLYFGNPCRLSSKDAQCIITLNETNETKSIPIEDIGMVVIDNCQITLSHSLVCNLIENNVALLWCNNKHLPEGLTMPMSVNNTYTEKIKYQINASEPLKKQLWKQTIEAKIKNQAAILKELNKPYENMIYFASKVGSGDPQNIEGRAAASYWKILFDDIENFTRGRFDDPPNSLLNYGYAILRAIVARSLVASGLFPVMGIHHKNKYNPFCLADDIMEPYRPYVDRIVINIVKTIGVELNKETKAKLLQIPVIDINIDNSTSPLMVGMQRTTASLMRCFEGSNRKILYPEI